jgi:hypothetical protein
MLKYAIIFVLLATAVSAQLFPPAVRDNANRLIGTCTVAAISLPRIDHVHCRNAVFAFLFCNPLNFLVMFLCCVWTACGWRCAVAASLAAKGLVFDRLAYICDTFGPRFSGTKGLEDAIDHVMSVAKLDGLEVSEEAVMVPKWVRGNEYARMITPRIKNLHFAGRLFCCPAWLLCVITFFRSGLGMSTGTGGKVLQAEVMVVDSFDELTG